MTKDQIMQMARDSGLAELSEWSEKHIERFAELVASAICNEFQGTSEVQKGEQQ